MARRKRRASAKSQEVREEIFTLQATFHARLIELHNVHSQELVTFAGQSAAALEREALRPAPVAVQLKGQARLNANNQNYAPAEACFEESNRSRKDQPDARQSAVRQLFEKELSGHRVARFSCALRSRRM